MRRWVGDCGNCRSRGWHGRSGRGCGSVPHCINKPNQLFLAFIIATKDLFEFLGQQPVEFRRNGQLRIKCLPWGSAGQEFFPEMRRHT